MSDTPTPRTGFREIPTPKCEACGQWHETNDCPKSQDIRNKYTAAPGYTVTDVIEIPTPIVDAAERAFIAWEKRSDAAGMRGSHLDSDDPQPADGWETARELERENVQLKAKVAELEAMYQCAHCMSIEAERDAALARAEKAEAWKESALRVEEEFDVQELAKLLGGKLGESCREVIQRRVPELLALVSELEKDKATLRGALERVKQLNQQIVERGADWTPDAGKPGLYHAATVEAFAQNNIRAIDAAPK